MVLFGSVAGTLGKFAEAEEALQAGQKEWKHPTAYQVAALESVLGTVQLRLGKRDLAEATLKHCLSDMETRLGPSNPWIGLVLSNLAVLRQEQGKFEEALALLNHATT